MQKLTRIGSLFYLKVRPNGQRITVAISVVILCYLTLYSIFNVLYLDQGVSGLSAPAQYDIKGVMFTDVGCSFPISGQYQEAPRYICYLLLTFTVIIRNHKWLSTGAAASVMTYSGVAAIHIIIIFATNNRSNVPRAKSHCESLPMLSTGTPFLACAGVSEPDSLLIISILSSVMLGALPMVAWSSTFRESESKRILIFWLLLLAAGHTFSILGWTDPNRYF